MKKILALVLAVMLVLGAASFATAESKTYTGWGAFTFNDQTGLTSYSEQLIWKQFEERQGIKIEWTTVSANDKNNLFSLVMSDPSNLPDFMTDMSPQKYEEFGLMGALTVLNDYINEETMPNLWALIKEEPSILASITSADGNIYFLPRIMEAPTRYWNGMFVNAEMLKAAGKEVPTTTEEFYDVMKAIKELDGVEYPLAFDKAGLKDLVWAWGIGARGQGTSTYDDAYIDAEGKIAYAANSDAYRDALAFLNKLYADGLINPDWASLGGGDIRTAIVTGTAAACTGSFSGVMSTYNNLMKTDGQTAQLTYITGLTGPEGTFAWQGHHMCIDVGVSGALSVTCEDPETLLKALDYLYGDEGRELVYWGVEGETFNMVDGKHVFTDELLTSELGYLLYLNNYSNNTSNYPSAMITEFYHATLNPDAAEGNLALTAKGEEHDIRMPAFRYSAEESSEINMIETDLNAYVDEWFALFINGTKDVANDADWQEYLNGFNGLRLDELLGYYNTGYERWSAIANQ